MAAKRKQAVSKKTTIADSSSLRREQAKEDGVTRGMPTSFRFSQEAQQILWRLSAFEGISQTSFLEQMLRREGRERGILPSAPSPIKK